MARFDATVRLFDLEEPDASTARRTIEERLQASGFTRWQIVSVGFQGVWTPPLRSSRRPSSMHTGDADAKLGGRLMAALIVAWALWFVWVLAG